MDIIHEIEAAQGWVVGIAVEDARDLLNKKKSKVSMSSISDIMSGGM